MEKRGWAGQNPGMESEGPGFRLHLFFAPGKRGIPTYKVFHWLACQTNEMPTCATDRQGEQLHFTGPKRVESDAEPACL